MIEVHNWTVVTPQDNIVTCPKVYGRIFGHPKMNNGEFAYLANFAFFDRKNKIGRSISGNTYILKNFESRKNMENENDALDMIEKTVYVD